MNGNLSKAMISLDKEQNIIGQEKGKFDFKKVESRLSLSQLWEVHKKYLKLVNQEIVIIVI